MSKSVLVTGGNRGIGLEICKQLAASGWLVYMGSRNVKAGKRVASSLEGDVRVVELDVMDEHSIRKAFLLIEREVGKLDALVNNGAVLSQNSRIIDADLGEVRAVMETNFFGPWLMIGILYPLLKLANDGQIINVSSSMGKHRELKSGYAGYRLSKAALNDFTIQLANELEEDGIKVNAVCPGWVRTDMGGARASRSVEEGADSIVWLLNEAPLVSGRFWKDREEIAW